jgi:hypothetical protein
MVFGFFEEPLLNLVKRLVDIRKVRFCRSKDRNSLRNCDSALDRPRRAAAARRPG